MNSMKSSTILGITLFMLVISYAWFSMLQDWLIHFICMKQIIMPNGFWFSSFILVLFCNDARLGVFVKVKGHYNLQILSLIKRPFQNGGNGNIS
jgi:hypothetical protein